MRYFKYFLPLHNMVWRELSSRKAKFWFAWISIAGMASALVLNHILTKGLIERMEQRGNWVHQLNERISLHHAIMNPKEYPEYEPHSVN